MHAQLSEELKRPPAWQRNVEIILLCAMEEELFEIAVAMWTMIVVGPTKSVAGLLQHRKKVNDCAGQESSYPQLTPTQVTLGWE